MPEYVYKSKDGERAVRELVSEIYSSYTGYEYEAFEVETRAGKTHVMHFGDSSKRPLVMLHGTMSNSAAWFGSIGRFIDDFSIYLVDMPGEPGLSEPGRMKLDSGMPAGWLLDLADNLGIGAASLICMSLGSWYGINFAVTHPERVGTISLLTASGIAPARTGFIFKALFYMLLGKKGRDLLNKAVYYKTPQITGRLYMKFQECISKYFRPMTDAIPLFPDEQLRKLQLPLQYFGGTKDVLLNTAGTGERLSANVPQAEINILDETGHVIIDKFDEIHDFIMRNS